MYTKQDAIPEEVRGARLFAINAHGEQRYGSYPYVKHLDDVFNVLLEFGCDDLNILKAAYLHDVLEDTNCDPLKLHLSFGAAVAVIVDCVTSRPVKNRKERNRATYLIIRTFVSSIMLKLADRIANVRACIADNDSKLEMYRKEYPEFRHALHTEDQSLFGMWEELDCLMDGALQTGEPR